MNNRILQLMNKEYNTKIRQGNTILGIFLFSVLFCMLLSFLIRHLTVRVEDIGLIALPGFWIVFLSTIFRYSLHSYSEEISSGIFIFQKKAGYKVSEIFYVKLFFDVLISLLFLGVQAFAFYVLLGIPGIVLEISLSVFAFAVALPALISIASLGACMSLKIGKEEVLMPILVIPLLLLISVSVISYGESVFSYSLTYSELLKTELSVGASESSGNRSSMLSFFDSFWIKSVCGISIVMLTVSSYIFNAIISVTE